MVNWIVRIAPTLLVFALTCWLAYPVLNEQPELLALEKSLQKAGEAPLLISQVMPDAVTRDPFHQRGRVGPAPDPPAPPGLIARASASGRKGKSGSDTVARWKLDGTLTGDGQQLAIINGRICAQGSVIPLADTEEREVRVSRIDRREVQLEAATWTAILHYGQPTRIRPR